MKEHTLSSRSKRSSVGRAEMPPLTPHLEFFPFSDQAFLEEKALSARSAIEYLNRSSEVLFRENFRQTFQKFQSLRCSPKYRPSSPLAEPARKVFFLNPPQKDPKR